MRFYNFLSKISPSSKRYAIKFFLIALPVILFPLIELIIFVLMSKGKINASINSLVVSVVLLTLLAAFMMLFLYNKLLSPLHLAKKALNNYITSNEVPQLPMDHKDEAGTLLGDIQTTITQIDLLLTEKSDMIDLLSHDLRSPVGRIMSLSTLIKTDVENSELYADYITNECKGLLRILENILMMLKEDNNSFTLNNVNLKQLMLDTMGFFDFPVAEKNLNVQVDIEESLHVVVQQELFTQALRNIIGNAIKFSADDMSIFIAASYTDEQISLTIKDQGLGFQPGDSKKIFERFTSAGKKGTHGEKSTGLGMYLSKKIVEKHGGKLLAESDGINKGAKFTIVLNRLVIKKRHKQLSAGKRTRPSTSVLS